MLQTTERIFVIRLFCSTLKNQNYEIINLSKMVFVLQW